MTGLVRFLHLLATAAWLGGALATMTLIVTVRSEPVPVRALAYQLSSRLYARLVAPAALVAVLSGLALTMALAMQGFGAMLGSPRLVVMQAAGIIAGLLVLFVGLPTANKLAQLAAQAKDTLPPEFEEVRKRQAIVQSVAGVLIIIALYAVSAL